jgi:hypothetical protein
LEEHIEKMFLEEHTAQ